MIDQPENRFDKPEELDSLLRAIASERVEGVERPQPLETAKRRARLTGKDNVDEVLAEDRARLRRTRYPGPECLQPYEVERYFLGALKPERAAHRNTCAGCSALLHAATPSESGAEHIVDEVRDAAQELGRAAAHGPRVVPEAGLRRWYRWFRKPEPVVPAFLTDALGATVPMAIAVSCATLLYRFAPVRFVPASSPNLGVASAIADTIIGPILGILAVAVILSVASAWLMSRIRVGGPVWRQSGGALVGGVVLALVAGVYVWWDLGQRARDAQIGVTLLSARLAQVAAASLDVHRTTGMFADVESAPGAVALSTAVHDRDLAEYRAHAKGSRGQLVAVIRPDGGEVYWQTKGNREQVAKLIVGTVESVTSDGMVVRTSGGTGVAAPRQDSARKPGDPVVAMVSSHTHDVIGVYPVARVSVIIPTMAATP